MKKLILKLTLLLLVLAGIASSCNPEPEKEYPIELSFTEYSLPETSCQWINLPYDEKVLIINSKAELEKYISCTESTYPTIDFAKKSLLLVSGVSSNKIPEISISHLQQLAANKYSLNIMVAINNIVEEERWVKALTMEKTNPTSNVELRITLDIRIDFNNIPNLYEQPLPIIKKIIDGKWQFNFIIHPHSIMIYQKIYDRHVTIDTKNNSVHVISGENAHLNGNLWNGFLHTPSFFSWERKDVFFDVFQPNNYTTYVMQFDNELEFPKPGGIPIKVGWYFDKIIDSVLYVFWDNLPACQYCEFSRIIE